MGYSRFWLKNADEDSKSIPHEFPSSHWLKATVRNRALAVGDNVGNRSKKSIDLLESVFFVRYLQLFGSMLR